MAESTIWWVLAGGAVALELATGTFYLLMICVGMAAGALAAHLGLALPVQVLVAAAVGGGSVAVWHWQRGRGVQPVSVNANSDVHMDIGEPVLVDQWNSDGTATVKYRGANWTAIAAMPMTEPGAAGLYRIKEMIGNRLVIEKL